MHIRDILVKTLGILSPLGKRIETIYDLADTSRYDENARIQRLFPRLAQEYGVTIAYALFLIFPSEIKRMEQIEYSILPTKDAGAVMALKESISSDCGMFAVAVSLALPMRPHLTPNPSDSLLSWPKLLSQRSHSPT